MHHPNPPPSRATHGPRHLVALPPSTASLSTATISPAYGSPPTQRNPLVDPPARPSQEGAMINSKMKPQPGEGGDCGRDKVVGP
jgi:hypothetical protein